MTIDDITFHVRHKAYGLLTEGEIVQAVEMGLQAHGGIDPADVKNVSVVFANGSLDIRFEV
jgi:hypothetical protein